jgi:hypothetical protein
MDKGTSQKEYTIPSPVCHIAGLAGVFGPKNLVCARPSKLSQVWSYLGTMSPFRSGIAGTLCLHGSIESRYCLVSESLMALE